jgi:hypothetical protein
MKADVRRKLFDELEELATWYDLPPRLERCIAQIVKEDDESSDERTCRQIADEQGQEQDDYITWCYGRKGEV